MAAALVLALVWAAAAAAQSSGGCSLPCLHGSCAQNNGGFACACDDGFAGVICEAAVSSTALCAAPSVLPYCANGGACPTGNATTCACPPSSTPGSVYRGVFCEFVAVVCPSNPGMWCANNGTCTATGFQCNCPPAWAGQRCELALLETPPPPSAVAAAAAPASSPPGTVAVPNWVAAPIVVGALLLLCLVACVAALVVRERRGAPIFAPLLERGALSSSSRARELAAHAAAAVHGPGADKV